MNEQNISTTLPSVFIVEDELLVAEHLKMMVQQSGYRVQAVTSSGEAAIKDIEANQPDLILMDIHLAGELDGIETANMLRSRFSIPVIFLSAYSDKATLQRAKITEPSAYLIKPLQERELLITLDIALRKHHLEQKIAHINSVLQAVRKVSQCMIKEKDRTRLLQQTCRLLIETRGYEAAWIVSDAPRELSLAFIPSRQTAYAPLHQLFDRQDLPPCAAQARKQNNVVVVEEGDPLCAACPLYPLHTTVSTMSTPLSYEQRFYGVLTISVVRPFRRYEEEQQVFREIGNDLAFALHGLEQERKRQSAEEALMAERALLAERVRERTAELQQINLLLQEAKEQAEAASRAKSEFLASMSHDLRTPLNAILGYAQILRASDHLNERERDGLSTIQHSGEHLLKLINEILDLSKIEAGRIEIQVGNLAFSPFLDQIAKMIRMRCEQKGLIFEYHRQEQLPNGIRADEKRLQEILLNLLDNAVKYTQAGMISFSVSLLPPANGFGELPMLQFTVEDTGEGIAPEDIDLIFSPFKQVGKHDTPIEGTGLGLSICKKLAELMGGTLNVSSQLHVGTRFWFQLPYTETTGEVSISSISTQRVIGYKGARRTILVADDEAANRAVLVGMLFPLGFEIITVENGLECLETALDIHPDLILLDLRMPVMDGFGTTEQIRHAEAQMPPGSRKTIIIAVSASVFQETRQRAFLIGFNDFLIKPISLEKLLALLEQHLHLEWVYQKELDVEQPTENMTENSSKIAADLPRDACETLLALAQKGRIKKLLHYLDDLEASPTYSYHHVKELRHLARHLYTNELIQQLEQLIHEC